MTASLAAEQQPSRPERSAPTVLLVDAGAPVVLAPSGSLLLIAPDQPLGAAVRTVLDLLPVTDPATAREWIAGGTFPHDAAGGTR